MLETGGDFMRGRINGTLVLGAVLALLSAPVAADAATPDELAGQVRAAAVSEGWKRFFAGAEAPFSWRPETVEVLPSGTLALSSGPVLDPSGAPAGVFTSIWRLEADGKWRVVFDRGCPPCAGPEKP
jgi:ketosteroid isomerase-like protein